MENILSKNKINLVMIFSFTSLLIISAYFIHNALYDYAVETNLEKSKQLRKEIMLTRDYLSNIAPKVTITDNTISPFAVTPAFVTSHITSEMSKNEKIYIKQTSLDYRNPANKPDKFEAEILKKYKIGKIKGEYYELNKFQGKDSLRYTYPIYVKQQCLACHGKPYVDVDEKTYKLLIQNYGDVAFNYKLNDLRGMLSIAIDIELIDSTVSKLDKNIFILFVVFITFAIILLYVENKFVYQPKLKKIELLNSTLSYRVKKEIEKNRQKEHILVEQSKLAQMGEMMNMIAHQWRQPLNVISTQMVHLKLKKELDTLSNENIEQVIEIVSTKTQELSKIIDDFMKFNQPGAVTKFKIKQAVENTHNIIHKQMENKEIVLDISDIDENLEVVHNQKAIEHVLLNLVVNSRDAFEENPNIKNPKIQIKSCIEDDQIVLKVIDNAGGIPNDIINKIFNPYFTTKDSGKGTGIGLYMSKKMVEEIKGSKLTVKVDGNTTTFSIIFTKK